MAAKRDYYQILGVSSSASEDELKKAYRKLAMQLHPDRNPSEDAKKQFQEVQEAYGVLSDSQKRAMYDQLGHAGFEQAASGRGPDFGGMGDVFSDLGSIFGDLFGGGRGTRQTGKRSQRGSDLRYNLLLSLEEAVFGCTMPIRIPRAGHCKSCEGSGSRKGTKPTVCRTCDGAGQVYLQHGPFSIQQTCPDCQGVGQIISSPCPECHGQGQVRETRNLSIKVPPGVDEGDRIRLSGEGEAGSKGGASGDLYVQIQLKPHTLFKRKGQNLYCEMPISYATAVIGGEVDVPTLEGTVRLQVPSAAQSGTVLRLRGKGIPGSRGNATGDLFCTLMIETVVKLDSAQRKLLEQFESSLKQSERHYPRLHQWLESMRRFFKQVK